MYKVFVLVIQIGDVHAVVGCVVIFSSAKFLWLVRGASFELITLCGVTGLSSLLQLF